MTFAPGRAAAGDPLGGVRAGRRRPADRLAEPGRPGQGQRRRTSPCSRCSPRRRSCWSWWWRCSSATRWPPRRPGPACATCWPRRSRGPGCCGRRRSWPALLSLAAIVLLPVVALLVGSLAYGTGNLVSPTGESLTLRRRRRPGAARRAVHGGVPELGGRAGAAAVGVHRRPARCGRRRGDGVDRLADPGPDHRAGGPARLPAHALRHAWSGLLGQTSTGPG